MNLQNFSVQKKMYFKGIVDSNEDVELYQHIL